MTHNRLNDALQERILLLDGGFGTMVQRYGLSEADYRGERFRELPGQLRGCNDLLNLTRPDIIREIHTRYLQAGADLITTNSFNANAISLTDYGISDLAREIARAAASIARAAADEYTQRNPSKPRFVAGSMGPTNRTASMSADVSDPAAREVTFSQLAEAYGEQARGLVEGGADVLLIETVFDTLNAKAALYAVDRLGEELGRQLPVMVSGTLADASGRTLSGQTVEAFWVSVSHARLLSVGLNCAYGARQMLPYLERLAAVAEVRVSAHPNAGLPNVMGGYDETPEMFAADVEEYLRRGLLNIVGGCCGTTPEHIFELSKIVGRYAPRPLPAPCHETVLSGLEPLRIVPEANFINVGERTNVAGSARFARLIREHNYEEALSVARAQVEAGAQIVDVCMDDGLIDGVEAMRTFLNLMASEPEIARVPTMIDSSKWEVLRTGLEVTQGKSVVNSISLKEGEESFLRRAREIHRYGAAVVVMLFDERGQADTYERKIEVAARAYRLLTEAGFPPEDIIFDPNILAVATGIAEHDRYALDFIEAVRWIKAHLPYAKVSGGVSNLSFAFRGNNAVREAMHSAFLYHAIRAGLDMAIVNPSMLQIYDGIRPDLLRCVEDVIFDADEGATERLIAKAAEIAEVKAQATEGKADGGKPAPAVPATPEERLAEALVRGKTDTLEADLTACMAAYGRAVSIIEGPLMDGMKRVGRLFGDGRMFLPQVVKSAKVMKQAVDILQPYMESAPGGDGTAAKPRVVIATVKGDVHDIGKNITAIVLGCNGFAVTDLGVMVGKETIIDAAVRGKADIIGVSGLITPSLYQMEELCRELAARGLHIPLFIGGATTSALHTAVKLAPLYAHVYHGADASATAVMAKRYMADRDGFEREEHGAQQRLRTLYAEGGRKADTASPEATESRAAGHVFAPERYLQGVTLKDVEAAEVPIEAVMPYFDWRMLLSFWDIKAGKTDASEPAVAALKRDAEALISRLSKSHGCRIVAALQWYDAYSDGDAITINAGQHRVSLPMMRQERPSKLADGREARLALSDFVPPADYGFTSPAGFFAISVDRTAGAERQAGASVADYDALLEQSVMNTLAEAASAWLDERIRTGNALADGWRLVKPAAGYASCPDHTLKRDILRLIPCADRLGITLTDSCAMRPEASICGMAFVHKDAAYPDIRRVSRQTVDDYAARRGMTGDEARRFLGHLLE